MYRILLFLLCICISFETQAQDTFEFPSGVDRIEIPFQSAYNLIVLPVNVNGVELNMILDTGASKSIIFNLSGIDSLQVNQGNLLVVEGYGKEKTFRAYYSEGNVLDVNGYKNNSANIFIAAEKEINLLPTLGFEVHGLLSTQFFKDALVEIDYLSRTVWLYRNENSLSKAFKKMKKVPLSMHNGKPFIQGVFKNKNQKTEAELLLDTGSGDALWILRLEPNFRLDIKGFEDYLGLGLNGDVFGIRSKMHQLAFGGFELNKVTFSQPKAGQFLNTQKSANGLESSGSIGGEILSRFHIIFDYKNYALHLSPNEQFKYGYFYNMAGIDILAGEKELFTSIASPVSGRIKNTYSSSEGQKTVYSSPNYEYKMVPKLFVNYVRPESPAAAAGVKSGDEILNINGVSKGNLTLDNTSSKFFKNPYSKIKLKVRRGEKELKFNFRLIPVIE